MTGLVNRRRFLEIAETALQRAKKEQGQLSVIMLDIDHFKNVNDQYGHKVGDEVLASVAARIKKSLRRGGDVAGRYGGEEFIVLISDTPPEICFKIAERIRQAVAQAAFAINETALHVTISLGLASLGLEQAPSLDDLISCADQAMYQAKQQGRNCAVAWKP